MRLGLFSLRPAGIKHFPRSLCELCASCGFILCPGFCMQNEEASVLCFVLVLKRGFTFHVNELLHELERKINTWRKIKYVSDYHPVIASSLHFPTLNERKKHPCAQEHGSCQPEQTEPHPISKTRLLPLVWHIQRSSYWVLRPCKPSESRTLDEIYFLEAGCF